MPYKIKINVKDIKSILVYIVILLFKSILRIELVIFHQFNLALVLQLFYYYFLFVIRLTFVSCALHNLLSHTL